MDQTAETAESIHIQLEGACGKEFLGLGWSDRVLYGEAKHRDRFACVPFRGKFDRSGERCTISSHDDSMIL